MATRVWHARFCARHSSLFTRHSTPQGVVCSLSYFSSSLVTASRFNFKYPLNVKARQELLGLCSVELPILGFDTKEEPVASGQRKLRYVEYRMVRRRET